MNITIPIPQKISTNSIYGGIHWAKRKKVADLYHQALLEHRNKPITEYPVDINYIFTFKSKPLDSTNCAFMAKMIEDGLIQNNILEDDSYQHVSFTGIYTQKGESDQVQIIIT